MAIDENDYDDQLAEKLSLNVEVTKLGTIVYRNGRGVPHRIHGPAVIWENGNQHWYKDGQLHREGGPAVVYSNGSSMWFVDGQELVGGSDV